MLSPRMCTDFHSRVWIQTEWYVTFQCHSEGGQVAGGQGGAQIQ